MGLENKRTSIVAVIGASTASKPVADIAFAIGVEIQKNGWNLVCGGGGGVMEAACRGFRESQIQGSVGGSTIGILPGENSDWANDSVDIPIPTGMGWARNAIITRMADVVVAVGGCSGTLSEIAFAWQMGKPIVAMKGSGGWSERLAGEAVDGRRDDTIFEAACEAEAVEYILSKLKEESAP